MGGILTFALGHWRYQPPFGPAHLVVTIPTESGWSNAIEVEKLPDDEEHPVVVDMDPVADLVLFWVDKHSRREPAPGQLPAPFASDK